MHDPNLAIVINILGQIFECPVPEDVQDFSPQPDPPANLNLLRRSTSDFPSEVDAAIQGNIDPVGNRDQTFKLLSESANLPALEPFFGRESELGALARLLEPPPQSKASWAGRFAKPLEPGSTSSQQIVSVYGSPGIGKTQFITQYIKSHRGNYDNIFFLDGTTIERLRLTLRREANRMRQSWSDLFFKALKLADTHSGNVERFCTFLNSDGNDKWLLVIDELRESSPSVTAIFERLKQGSIVLVSSSSQPATRYPAVRLGPLEQSPSIEMLLHYSPTSNLKVTSEHHNLLSTLEHHPTLIRLAVPKMLGFKTISYFVQNWNDGKIKLPSQMVARIRGILEDEFPGGSTSNHHNLLNFCLLINHKAVSYEFLEFLNLRDLELFFSDTTERFARHGLLETRIPYSQTVTCSISAVLYLYLRQSIKNWPDNLMTGARIVALKVPRSSKDNYRASIEILAPHAKIFAKYIINTPKRMNPQASYLDDMERIASLLRLLGHDSDAIKLYGYIHEHHKQHKRFGELALTDARTAELYNNMGLSCLNEGDITFACSCFDKAIATLKIGNLANSSTMLEVIANVARAKLETEDYVAAEDLLVDMLSKFQGNDQGSLLPLQHFLGSPASNLGRRTKESRHWRRPVRRR
ncbi:hypothetical protein BGZ57DRAFT_345735 [Hyaloscypha finlandica]|nr:hypothetical protein BGZ57DRAFT_345735 [Hyaloscypha finlandica]